MSLDDLRQRIDDLDSRIIELLNERAGLAVKIGDEKRHAGSPVFDAGREDEVISRLRGMCREPLDGDAVERIYREVIAACTDLQKQGPDEDVQ
ncbi:chorismate mutase [Verrucomicrobiota bacterium]